MTKFLLTLANFTVLFLKKKSRAFRKKSTIHYPTLCNKTGRGNDFLGWVDLPSQFDTDLFRMIEEDAQRLRENSEIFVVIGIGGSYLGARAVIEALGHQFYDLLDRKEISLHHLRRPSARARIT